jgi:hypothetical protein
MDDLVRLLLRKLLQVADESRDSLLYGDIMKLVSKDPRLWREAAQLLGTDDARPGIFRVPVGEPTYINTDNWPRDKDQYMIAVPEPTLALQMVRGEYKPPTKQVFQTKRAYRSRQGISQWVEFSNDRNISYGRWLHLQWNSWSFLEPVDAYVFTEKP